MAKIAVTAIIEHNGQVIVGKKIKMDGHFLSGKWHIPGGKLNSGENETDAIVREMQEEAGIKINVVRFLDEFYNEKSDVMVRWYLCQPLTFDLTPGDDLEEVKFVPKKDVATICDREAVSRWPQKVIEYFESG